LDRHLFYSKHPHVDQIKKSFRGKGASKFLLKGLQGSSKSLFLASYFEKNKGNHLVILNDKEEAAYFYSDLVTLLGEKHVFFFPSAYRKPLSKSAEHKTDNSSILQRAETLNSINDLKGFIVVSYPKSITEKTPDNQNIKNSEMPVKAGMKIDLAFLVEYLDQSNFSRADFVYEPGQFAVRGSIVDVFSYSNEYPYRIDFFGNEIESIRTFDVVTQLSKKIYDSFVIMPNISNLGSTSIPFLDCLPPETALWASDFKFVADRMDIVVGKTLIKTHPSDSELDLKQSDFYTGKSFLKRIDDFSTFEFSHHSYFKDSHQFLFITEEQPAINKNFDLLMDMLREKTEKSYKIYILSDNPEQIVRLKKIFDSQTKEFDTPILFEPLNFAIHQGFIDHDLKLACYTDHQIFNRFHKFKIREELQVAGKEAMMVNWLRGLNPGDYIVHIDHGIGRFGGLEKIEVNGKFQEAIKLVYLDNDTLFVSIHALHKISKYKGQEGEPPKIYKLGSGVWQKLKNKAKGKIKDIAKELILLYAQRKAESGFAFTSDTYLQTELESSFIYEDTPDQNKANREIKKDMESSSPMDRLVCGDVGFGKTELAIRAAFKAATDGKQVAVLVPTTILAWQHFKTFSDRLKDFPVTVDYISRMKSAKAQKETLDSLAEGKVDIIIGTHRIVGKDVKFKDLGLLVIDEEQKFGVAVKDKLKKIKLNVDTLTLTATPIPRTLEFSLMGARDLSIIHTPPPNRYPIYTELHTFDHDVIQQAIDYELSRNGQVFFVHNRIANLAEIEKLVTALCPLARPVIAHGQMEGDRLEKILIDFINEEYNVLIATTIIENGVDIPNANTMIINDAHTYGLSDLHQLRGRVGRSNKKAFCYLMAAPASVLTSEARRRLTAIETFTELGSGFNIALQDLDIRGAGNLLGGEQSGFIADIGFETYQRVLNEALLELKESEFGLLLKEDVSDLEIDNYIANNIGSEKFVNDCQIDTDLEILLPDSYIESISERIKLYREMNTLTATEQLKKFESNLIDRFGPLPKPAVELLRTVEMKWLAMRLGIEKLLLKRNKMIVYFVSNPDSPFYHSKVFVTVLDFVKFNPSICKMQEGEQKLRLSIDNVKSVDRALAIFTKILDKIK